MGKAFKLTLQTVAVVPLASRPRAQLSLREEQRPLHMPESFLETSLSRSLVTMLSSARVFGRWSAPLLPQDSFLSRSEVQILNVLSRPVPASDSMLRTGFRFRSTAQQKRMQSDTCTTMRRKWKAMGQQMHAATMSTRMGFSTWYGLAASLKGLKSVHMRCVRATQTAVMPPAPPSSMSHAAPCMERTSVASSERTSMACRVAGQKGRPLRASSKYTLRLSCSSRL
mmetsp:Transcript_2488/g.7354  ORF Transcript_2488/g.7354 Transcript_2488/m.7354 type:complete len:226 (+) Transcript_2488:3-680(+)